MNMQIRYRNICKQTNGLISSIKRKLLHFRSQYVIYTVIVISKL